MGVETALAIGGVGALAGGLKGAKGTPDQTTTTGQTHSIEGAGSNEQALAASGQQNYNQAGQLVDQQQQQLASHQNVEDQAQGLTSNILNGSAFNLTPQQDQQLQAIRNSTVQQGTADVQNLLNQNIQGVNASAAARGVRGQALSATQGNAIGTAGNQLADIVRQANSTYAQQALQTPYQQAQLQSGVAQQNMSYADQLRQQAETNRTALSNPSMLNYYLQGRAQNSTTSGTNTTPGQEGSFGQALIGGLGGGAAGFGIGSNLYGAYKQLSGGSCNSPTVPTANNAVRGQNYLTNLGF